MKNLIRKILKEELGRKIVSIKYVGRKPLKESTYYEYIDSDIKNKIKETFGVQQVLAKSVSPLLAEYRDKRTGQIKKAYFNLLIDEHFAERTYRPETFPSDPNFFETGIDEGINVVVGNINEIWRTVYTRNYGFSDVLRLQTKNGINYEILVRLNTPSKLNKLPIYDLTLWNQMKGPMKNFNKEKKLIKVYNPIG